MTEIFGDPDYRRPTSVRREVEPCRFRAGGALRRLPVYTLNFRRPEYLAT